MAKKSKIFKLTNKLGENLSADKVVMRVYKDKDATELAEIGVDVESNLLQKVDENNPYRLYISWLKGGTYFVKADNEDSIMTIELKDDVDLVPTMKINKANSLSDSINTNTPENILDLNEKTIVVSSRGDGDYSNSAVAFYDVSEAIKPILIFKFQHADLRGAMRMATKGKYLFVQSLYNAKTICLDISDVNDVQYISTLSIPIIGTETYTYAIDIHQSGKWAFTATRDKTGPPEQGRFISIDIQNPASMSIADTETYAGEWCYHVKSIGNVLFGSFYNNTAALVVFDINESDGTLTEIRILNDLNLDVVDIQTDGQYLFFANFNTENMQIWSINNLSAPTLVSTLDLSTYGKPNRIVLDVEKNIAIIPIYDSNKVVIVDISVEDYPEIVSVITDDNFQTTQSVYLKKNALYVASRDTHNVSSFYLRNKTATEFEVIIPQEKTAWGISEMTDEGNLFDPNSRISAVSWANSSGTIKCEAEPVSSEWNRYPALWNFEATKFRVQARSGATFGTQPLGNDNFLYFYPAANGTLSIWNMTKDVAGYVLEKKHEVVYAFTNLDYIEFELDIENKLMTVYKMTGEVRTLLVELDFNPAGNMEESEDFFPTEARWGALSYEDAIANGYSRYAVQLSN